MLTLINLTALMWSYNHALKLPLLSVRSMPKKPVAPKPSPLPQSMEKSLLRCSVFSASGQQNPECEGLWAGCGF